MSIDTSKLIAFGKEAQHIIDDVCNDTLEGALLVFKKIAGKMVLIETTSKQVINGAVDLDNPVDLRDNILRLQVYPMKNRKVIKLKRVIPLSEIFSIKVGDHYGSINDIKPQYKEPTQSKKQEYYE